MEIQSKVNFGAFFQLKNLFFPCFIPTASRKLEHFEAKKGGINEISCDPIHERQTVFGFFCHRQRYLYNKKEQYAFASGVSSTKEREMRPVKAMSLIPSIISKA